MVNLFCTRCGAEMLSRPTDKGDIDQAAIGVVPCRVCDEENKKLKQAINDMFFYAGNDKKTRL